MEFRSSLWWPNQVLVRTVFFVSQPSQNHWNMEMTNVFKATVKALKSRRKNDNSSNNNNNVDLKHPLANQPKQKEDFDLKAKNVVSDFEFLDIFFLINSRTLKKKINFLCLLKKKSFKAFITTLATPLLFYSHKIILPKIYGFKIYCFCLCTLTWWLVSSSFLYAATKGQSFLLNFI